MTSDYYIKADDSTLPNWGAITIGAADHANEVTTTYGTYVGKPERSENMRALYRIYAVNPKTEAIHGPYLVIAKDESGALLKAGLPSDSRTNPEDYDFIVDRLGDVRAKKDVQKVKMVKEGEE